MLKTKKVNLEWGNIDMSGISLDKLILHYAQVNKADGKSPKTVSWYSEMLACFANASLLIFPIT